MAMRYKCLDSRIEQGRAPSLSPKRQPACCPLPCPQICEAFGANRYPFPEEVPRQRQTHAEVTTRLRELATTIEAGKRQSQLTLATVAQSE